MIGKALGHYLIEEQIGEGGMGVVYRARDTHLDRAVALKILPPDKLTDPERKRRFIQEAKSASALNHPNIIHVYDIAESAGTLFIAMEYVSGKPLDQLIKRKGLSLREALKYAIQMADALAKAHSAGIVHRDLKPSNMMVTEDGLVKLLDFGLAKLTEPADTHKPSDGAETVTALESQRTAEGLIVGTVAYMSPEQGEGKRIDPRSDIFSFGAVLYEMVTGHRAFQGNSSMATLAAVLREEPKAASDVNEGVPRDLDRVISRCLRKDPERRWQTMSDLKVALLDLKEESESGILAAREWPHPRRNLSQWVPWLLVVVITLTAVGMFVFYRPRSRSAGPAVWRGVPLTTYPGREFMPSFSPDGNQVAFSWDGEDGRFHIYIKLIGPGRPLRLTNDSRSDFGPAWSPDGRSIAFYRHLGPGRIALTMVPALGGAERELAEFGYHPTAFLAPSWSPDGKWLVVAAIMAGADRNALFRCSSDTGEMIRLTEPPPEAVHGDDSPAVAPDGRSIAFVRSAVFSFTSLHVLPTSPDGKPAGTPRRIDTGILTVGPLAWTEDGREIVFNTAGVRPTMNRVPVDGSSKPVPLGLPEAVQPAISARAKRLAYAERHADTNLWMVDLIGADRIVSQPRKISSSTFREVNPQYSRDGRKIAFSSNRSGNYEIWVADDDGQNANQLTFEGAAVTGAPHWSPDGRYIAFDSNLAGSYNIYLIKADGGKARRLTNEASNIVPCWSPDGSRIFFGSNRSGRFEVWSMNSEGADLRQVTHDGGFGAQVSSDGQVYYARGDGNQTMVFKTPAAGGDELKVAEGVHRNSFVVIPNGMYFCGAAGKLVLRFLNFETGKISDLYSSDEPVDLGLTLSPDGRHILFAKVDGYESDLMLVEDFH